MGNTLLTPTVIAKEALMLLENNLVMGKLVNRVYESELGTAKVGDTVLVRKPVKASLRTGTTMQVQDTVEGSVPITVNRNEGVDLQFSSNDLTLTIEDFSNRYLKSPMSQIANAVDRALFNLYQNVWNWTTNNSNGMVVNKKIGSYADFAVAPERLENLGVPSGNLSGVLSPSDKFKLAGYFTAANQFFSDSKTQMDALSKNKLPMLGNVDLYSGQNVASQLLHYLSSGSPVVSSTAQVLSYTTSTYSTVAKTNIQTLLTSGWKASENLYSGDVFTIAGCYAVNPVTKVALPFLQQFVIVNTSAKGGDAQSVAATTNATTSSDTSIVISPAIVSSGPYQNVSAAPVAGAAITRVQDTTTAADGYFRQNMVFDKDAFALCMVPMNLPEAAAHKARVTHDGLSIRVVSDYDIVNDNNLWRLDVLYGVKTIYPELACRVTGAS
jgi:hypothetical protein